MIETYSATCLDHKCSPLLLLPCENKNGVKIALEGLYVQATGEEFNPPEPVCEREMRALAVFFEAMHGKRMCGFWNGTCVLDGESHATLECLETRDYRRVLQGIALHLYVVVGLTSAVAFCVFKKAQ